MSDSLVRDVPANRSDSESIKMRDQTELLAGLRKIDTDFHGLQIRIWYAYSSSIEHLILLTDSNNKWSGTLNTLKYKYDDQNRSLVSIDRTTTNVVPKSGWKTFTDSIISMGIIELPDMSAIPGYILGTDGNWFTVDFAQCRKYRYYSYQTPWADADKFWQAKQAVEISNLIEQELEFNRLLRGPKGN